VICLHVFDKQLVVVNQFLEAVGRSCCSSLVVNTVCKANFFEVLPSILYFLFCCDNKIAECLPQQRFKQKVISYFFFITGNQVWFLNMIDLIIKLFLNFIEISSFLLFVIQTSLLHHINEVLTMRRHNIILECIIVNLRCDCSQVLLTVFHH
jgi:hypothetical protein